ncbi:hypothetical protein Tco_0691444 [Tanacetum coccineum]
MFSHRRLPTRLYILIPGGQGIPVSFDEELRKPRASDEEIEGPMKDQPLFTDASPTALSPGYIANSDPEEDKEDPEEDPADG